MAASGGGLSSLTNVTVLNNQGQARARFPGRPWSSRNRLRFEKRPQRGRLGSDCGDVTLGGPRPINIGLTLSEDPSLLRLLGVTEKYGRQKDAGFESSGSEEEEDFTGFGTQTVCSHQLPGSSPLLSPTQDKPPPAPDLSPQSKPLIGKIVPRSPKPTLIGKIVQRPPKEGRSDKVRVPASRLAIKLPAKQVTPTPGTESTGRQSSGCTQTEVAPGLQRKAATKEHTTQGSTSAAGTKQDKLVCTLTVVKGKGRGSRLKGPGKGSKHAQANQSSGKGTKGSRHQQNESEVASQSQVPTKRQQKKKVVLDIGASPEAEALSGQAAPTPSQEITEDSPKKKPLFRKRRKLLFGRRQQKLAKTAPKLGGIKIRRVFYTYVPELVPAALNQEEEAQQLQGQSSSNSAAPVVSARSSRVIKAPKRFLDEEVAVPKRSLFKLGSMSEAGGSAQSPTSSHLEVYKNLKKLTSKLAEKKKGPSGAKGLDLCAGPCSNPPVRKRRRSKIKMEEVDTPGVVRKLAVLLNSKASAVHAQVPLSEPVVEGALDTDAQMFEDYLGAQDSGDVAEASGQSQRMSLTGANRRMLHLLKRAKVQLIKIDQQKQLKMSQLGSRELGMVASGRRRRRRAEKSTDEGNTQEQPLGGPRIKHVCRAAAVALGQPRAMVPDDIPRLSALPLHEREGIALSPVAKLVDGGDEDGSDQERAQWTLPQERVPRRWKRGRIRSRRCRICRGCRVQKDCGTCTNCLDKPKFGGPNTKRQCCTHKKCERIEKGKEGRIIRPFKLQARRSSPAASSAEMGSYRVKAESEEGLAANAVPPGDRRHSRRNITPRSYSNLLRSESDDESEAEERTVKPAHAIKLAHAAKLARAAKLAHAAKLSRGDSRAARYDVPNESVRHRRPGPKGSAGRYRAIKEQGKAEGEEPRGASPPRSPLPPQQQRQRCIQICLHRLPESALQSAPPPLAPPQPAPPPTPSAPSPAPLLMSAPPSPPPMLPPVPPLTPPLSAPPPLSPPPLPDNPSPPKSPQPIIIPPRTATRKSAAPSKKETLLKLSRLVKSHTTSHSQRIPIHMHPKLALSMRLLVPRLPDSVVRAASKSRDFVPPPPDPLTAECTTHPLPRQSAQPRLCLHRLAEPLVMSLVLPPQGHKVEEEEEEDGGEGTGKWSHGHGEEANSLREELQAHAPHADPHSLLRSQNAGECAPSSALGGLHNGFPHKGLLQSTRRIRVDFKEDCALKNVWLLGGLSVLTSIPTTPQPVCLLCASKGHHEMIYCQICCEPFHSFCLLPEERPQEENKENWCCRRCKFCHVCGRKSKSTKPVLQCRRCQNSYHPSCLGPTYPKPLNCSIPWVCMVCIRCKSCGVTPGKNWDMSWNHEQDLCPDCTPLYKKGNFCTVCHKCYESSGGPDQPMLQCAACSRFVHSKCEGVSEELFGLFSSQVERVAFTCSACSPGGAAHSQWRKELQGLLRARMEHVLTELLSSSTTQHLILCRTCEARGDVEYVVEEQKPVCDFCAVGKKFEKGCYTSIKAFHADVAMVMRRWLKQEEPFPEDQRPTTQAKEHYLNLMKQVFTWFHGDDQKMWDPLSKEYPGAMLPDAVLPPSREHSYAQWLERTYQACEDSPAQAPSLPDTKPLPETATSPPLKSHGLPKDVSSSRSRDGRQCVLCQHFGDEAPNAEGRLLYLGQNEWAHVNCCIWSAEVYEDNSALLQVHSAVSRGRYLRCDHCSQSGATVGCCLSSCQSNFHFMCARARNCMFQLDRKVYCYKHRDLVTEKMVSGKGFEVPRRIYVDFDGIALKRKFLMGLEPESIRMTIGSLQIQKLGVLSELSSNGKLLYPIGYQCSRLYWSTVDPRRRCKYTCRVTEVSTPLPGQEHDPRWDKDENQTIIHSPNHHMEIESQEPLSTSPMEVKSNTPSPNSKPPGARIPGYAHARKPAGGSSRPLPSPGSAPPKSHPILTLRDLDDTRRPRRLSSRSRCSSSPTESDPAGPRSGSGSRTALFGSPPRSHHDLPSTPPSPSRPGHSSASPPTSPSGFSPRRGGATTTSHSPKGRQLFRITTPVSAEVPQDFMASSEAEEAAVATTNGISLAPDILEEEVAQLMAQELPYTVFDADTEVAVASMLNTKIEFDEALLTENVALQFGPQGGGGGGEAAVVEGQSEETQQEDGQRPLGGGLDEDCSPYLKFSRVVVVREPSDEGERPGGPQTIPQLDGADGGSDSDESEAAGGDGGGPSHPPGPANQSTATEKLTVALQRLESVFVAAQKTPADPEPSSASLSAVPPLAAGPGTLDSHLLGEEVVLDSESSEREKGLLDPATGHFISTDDGTIVQLANKPGLVQDNTTSSTDSMDELLDAPAPNPPKSNVVHKNLATASVKRIYPKPCFPQHSSELRLPITSRFLHTNAPAAASSAPRMVTSPIVINGLNALNALPIQTGTPRGRTIAIRFDSSNPGAPQQLLIPAQAGASHWVTSVPPAPQVLLVNRQGQILIKDPRSNTYQTLNQNSPAYGRISQVAKMLHGGSALQRSVPRVIVKPRAGPSHPASLSSAPSTTPSPVPTPALTAPHTTAFSGRVIVRTLPVNHMANASVSAPPGIQAGTAQAIINHAMANQQRHTTHLQPIILKASRRPMPRILTTTQFKALHVSGKVGSPVAVPTLQPDAGLKEKTPWHHSQAGIKRLASLSDRPGRKRCRTDFMRDLSPSRELDGPQENRSSGVRIKSPTMKEVLDLDREMVPEKPKNADQDSAADGGPGGSQHSKSSGGGDLQGKTSIWVSAHHGDLSDWGPYSGFSSEEEGPPPKQDNRKYMNQPHLRFEITSDDGFSVKADSIEVAWRAVTDGVLEARAGFQLRQLPLGVVSGQRMLGVLHDATIFLLEQLEGAGSCRRHRFRFHRCDAAEVELPLNPSGCARAEVYTRKSTFDMFNFLASQHRQPPDMSAPCDEEDDDFPLKSSRRATSTELPMAMRFRHLERTSKEAVGVYRSEIHGRGLFCKRNIEAGEMVIEYAGNVIRAVLTDKREKYYDSKGIGCYMFRIDDFDVVDATMHGNAARFINHSCEPNCHSRVINVDGHKHIVILALRKIYRGEELTYDYKFPIEDENSKLHCNCATRRCRRFLN
ncbi:unnamed protein product [Lota lota]